MGFFIYLAEREGFEPSIGSHLRLISSQVHSTTLPPLREAAKYSDFALETQAKFITERLYLPYLPLYQ